MFRRHKVLLGVLALSPREPSRTELMKWLFLIKQETPLGQEKSFYDFVPYKFGPFSFTVYRDLDELRGLGFFCGDDPVLSTDNRVRAKLLYESLPVIYQGSIDKILKSYAAFSYDELIQYVYNGYPWFATKSEIAPHKKTNTVKGTPAVYTVGYEGISIDSFLRKIMTARIDCIIDVRSNPLSRKYGYSKRGLSQICEKVAIDYLHEPELGIPASLRIDLNSADDYDRLLRRYEVEMMPRTTEIRLRVGKLMKEKPSALLCFEADPVYCHRGRLSRAISNDTNMRIINL